ncbi:TIGR03936 family radical SAM-associated protein [Microaceticoccus formicicus]|uniref:TIGR03936 family radical SAM-associated protein n=1 Tax=Microaceticoccus formicicus TaxID=3118105 RepID=UPI003CD001CE|nr:TIGR03936 family radical SAM-associated protein [Peptoniphilaceae bacterium AMB_02]
MHIRGKFIKIGFMRLIGHLDLMKLFHRGLKRAGIELKYSEGFTPSPKLSIPNPLPLGTESVCEYIEFDTDNTFNPKTYIELINEQLPKGIEIIDLYESSILSSISREIVFSSYRIYIPDEYSHKDIEAAIDALLKLDSYVVIRKKKNKKKRRIDEIPIDIRSLIIDIKASSDDRGFYIEYVCHSSDGSNLRADVLIKGISNILGVVIDMTDLSVVRTGQYIDENRTEVSLEG